MSSEDGSEMSANEVRGYLEPYSAALSRVCMIHILGKRRVECIRRGRENFIR